MNKYSGFTYSLLFFILFQLVLFPQTALRKGVKFSMDLENFLSNKSGSFKDEPGFEAGLFTGVELYNGEKNAFLLKIELNYARFVNYRLNSVYTNKYYNNDPAFPRTIINDEKFVTKFIDIGVIPEYFFILNDETLLSFYLGPSIGFGGQTLSIINKNTNVSSYFGYAPYEDSTEGFPNFMVNMSAGVNLYYKIFLAGLRYKHCALQGIPYSAMIDNLSLSAGLAF